MILIADGGSTKCDWRVLNDEGKVLYSVVTSGVNPMHATSSDMHHALNGSDLGTAFKSEIREIYFFGSGCAAGIGSEKMESFLSSYFNQVDKICVSGDIEGAVYASSSGPSVVAILGTGSHACYYDGEEVKFYIPSLGYQVLDIGSGSMIGRELLRLYFLKKLPQELKIILEERYEVDVESVKNKLYNSSVSPSSYLASYARFAIEHKEKDSMKSILSSSIHWFFNDVLSHYDAELQDVPLYFIGSIASHCRDIVIDCARKNGYDVGGFVERPIEGLADNLGFLRSLV